MLRRRRRWRWIATHPVQDLSPALQCYTLKHFKLNIFARIVHGAFFSKMSHSELANLENCQHAVEEVVKVCDPIVWSLE